MSSRLYNQTYMSNPSTDKLPVAATVAVQWHGEPTRVKIGQDAEKTHVPTGGVINVSEEQAKQLFAYSEDWTLEGEKPKAQPYRKAQADAVKRLDEKRAAEAKKKTAKKEAVKKTDAGDGNDGDEKEPVLEPLTEADVDLMTTKAAASNALKARKVKHNARGASLDELKSLLKEAIAAQANEEKNEDGNDAGDGNDGESGELVDHVITQEDLDNNPDLVEQGVKVGDTIQLPAEVEEEVNEEEKTA